MGALVSLYAARVRRAAFPPNEAWLRLLHLCAMRGWLMRSLGWIGKGQDLRDAVEREADALGVELVQLLPPSWRP